METNKKQTAVEWLISELGEYFPHEIGGIHLMVDKAKQMEREQMKDIFLIGDEDGYKRCYYNGNHTDIDFYKMYEETYGKET